MGADASTFLLLFSGPSGAGKSSVYHPLMESDPRLRFSVSCTTRPPRPGEVDGRDYHFLDRAEFEAQVAAGAFAEHFTVHEQLYGTRKADLQELLDAGYDPVLDVDVQGGVEILRHFGERVVSIFLFAPGWEELERRLRQRGTEDEETLRVRLANARWEVGFAPHYRYWVVNDRLEEAVADVRAVVRAERLRRARGTEPPLPV